MPRSSRHLIAEAQRRFPVRVYLMVPPSGFGRRLDRMHAWLDENCGTDGWTTTPAGRAVVNDAVAFYFRDATLAAAFVTRWCVPSDGGFFKVREDEPTQRIAVRRHKTP